MAGNDWASSTKDEEPSMSDTFALVGHEIRAEIIRVLGDPTNDAWELSFSEVRTRVAVDVDPSQLHYHLEQLLGHFLAKTAEGYHLLPAGVHLCRALYAGTFGPQEETLRVDAEFDCHFCSAPGVAVFDAGHVGIVCSDCGHRYTGQLFDFPLKVFADGAEAFEHFRKYVVSKTVSLAQGVCPSCTNQLDPAIHLSDTHPGNVCIHPSCSQCGGAWDLSVMEACLVDPGVIGFCFDHGVDVLSRPWWELEFAVTDHQVTVRSTDPWEVSLRVTLDRDTLELIVDGDLNIIERSCLAAPDIQDALLPDKDACLEHLRRQRWPDGVTCPHCDSANTIKKGTTGKETKRYRCHTCDSIFNDLTGTIFAGHQLSLPEMVYIIREIEDTKTAQIVRQLDRSYPSIQDFIDEVQAARDGDPDINLPGLGEINDTLPPANENGST